MSREQELANAAAEIILRDLSDRSGIGNAIEACDADIQAEIKEAIAETIFMSMTTNSVNS